MSFPTNYVCCSIRPINLLTTEMGRAISGSSLFFWSFRKGHRIFAGFFSLQKETIRLESTLLNSFRNYSISSFFFTQKTGCGFLSHLYSSPPLDLCKKTLQGEAKLLIAFVNQSSATPCADFTHHRDICNNVYR